MTNLKNMCINKTAIVAIFCLLFRVTRNHEKYVHTSNPRNIKILRRNFFTSKRRPSEVKMIETNTLRKHCQGKNHWRLFDILHDMDVVLGDYYLLLLRAKVLNSLVSSKSKKNNKFSHCFRKRN